MAVCLALTVSAQEEKKQPDRLSGVVKSIDTKAMKIFITPRNSSAERVVLYDSATKIFIGDKEGKIEEVKESMRLVAVGKFEGVNLKATEMRARLR
jgi:hypothetical protein